MKPPFFGDFTGEIGEKHGDLMVTKKSHNADFTKDIMGICIIYMDVWIHGVHWRMGDSLG